MTTSTKQEKLCLEDRQNQLIRGIKNILNGQNYWPCQGMQDLDRNGERYEVMLWLETPWNSYMPFPENRERLESFMRVASPRRWEELKSSLDLKGGRPKITDKLYQQIVNQLWACGWEASGLIYGVRGGPRPATPKKPKN